MILFGICSREPRPNCPAEGIQFVTETGPSCKTLERGGSKGDRLKVAISLLGALGTYIHGTQREWSNLTNTRTHLYHTVTLNKICLHLPFNQLPRLPKSNYIYIHL